MNNKFNKFFIGVLSAVMTFSCAQFAALAENNVSVVVNGTTLYIDEGNPVIVGDGTTMVPFRAIFEALGFSVGYKIGDGYFRVYAVNPSTDLRIDMFVGEKELYTCSNDEYSTTDKNITEFAQKYVLAEAPFIDSTGSTLVPARAIAELSGAEVIWEQERMTVYINYEDAAFDGDLNGGFYAGTEIPTYCEVTGIASKSVDYGIPDEYFESLECVMYSYDYDKSNYDKYIKSIEAAGCVLIGIINDGYGAVYETETNEYLYIERISDNTLAIMPLVNMDIYLNCSAPNYTYYTGKKCFSWTDNSGDHSYFYLKNKDEVDTYLDVLLISGYTEISRELNADDDILTVHYYNAEEDIFITTMETKDFIVICPTYLENGNS